MSRFSAPNRIDISQGLIIKSLISTKNTCIFGSNALEQNMNIFFTTVKNSRVSIGVLLVYIKTSDVPDLDPDFIFKFGSGRTRTFFSNQDPAGTGSRSFFHIKSGRIRISDKNGNIWPDPDPDSESGTSLV